MTLKQLEYIVAVDTYRHFATAAQHCHVSQPSVSMLILKLEEQLGTPIFDRSRHPVVPTEFGTAIIARARRVLQEAAQLRGLVEGQKKVLQEELRVGVIPTLAPYLLPQLVHSLRQKYPQVQLCIEEQTTEVLIRKLKSEQLDCALLAGPMHDRQLRAQPLFREPFVVFMSPGHRLAAAQLVAANKLAPDELLLLGEGHCMRRQVLQICRQAAASSLPHYEAGSIEALKRMVLLNGGLTVLPELAVSYMDEKELACVKRFRKPEPFREISLVTFRPGVKLRLLKALEEEVLQLVAGNRQLAAGG